MAEDVAQETLLRGFQQLDRFDLARPMWPWLRVIASHAIADTAANHAARAVRYGETDEPASDVDDPANTPLFFDDRQLLSLALSRVPARQRLALRTPLRPRLVPNRRRRFLRAVPHQLRTTAVPRPCPAASRVSAAQRRTDGHARRPSRRTGRGWLAPPSSRGAPLTLRAARGGRQRVHPSADVPVACGRGLPGGSRFGQRGGTRTCRGRRHPLAPGGLADGCAEPRLIAAVSAPVGNELPAEAVGGPAATGTSGQAQSPTSPSVTVPTTTPPVSVATAGISTHRDDSGTYYSTDPVASVPASPSPNPAIPVAPTGLSGTLSPVRPVRRRSIPDRRLVWCPNDPTSAGPVTGTACPVLAGLGG